MEQAPALRGRGLDALSPSGPGFFTLAAYQSHLRNFFFLNPDGGSLHNHSRMGLSLLETL